MLVAVNNPDKESCFTEEVTPVQISPMEAIEQERSHGVSSTESPSLKNLENAKESCSPMTGSISDTPTGNDDSSEKDKTCGTYRI